MRLSKVARVTATTAPSRARGPLLHLSIHTDTPHCRHSHNFLFDITFYLIMLLTADSMHLSRLDIYIRT